MCIVNILILRKQSSLLMTYLNPTFEIYLEKCYYKSITEMPSPIYYEKKEAKVCSRLTYT